MTRFIQQDNRKGPKKEPKVRELPKPGKYTGQHLTEAKKILSTHGGKR